VKSSLKIQFFLAIQFFVLFDLKSTPLKEDLAKALNLYVFVNQKDRTSQIITNAHFNLETCDPNVLMKKAHMHQHTMINDSAQFSSQPFKQLWLVVVYASRHFLHCSGREQL
jgi:hypothetical protein